MSLIADFYLGSANSDGRTLGDVLSSSDGEWDAAHDFIQWVFPTPEPSMFNGDAPLATAEDAVLFRENPDVRKKLVAAFERFLSFLGLYFCVERLVVDEVPSEAAASRRRVTMREFNHNFLRFTRVLRSLSFLGQGFLAKAFHEYLLRAKLDRRFPESAVYWKLAVGA